MAPRFTVLGSGSAGNSSVLEYEGNVLLIDAGLGVRDMSHRLESIDRDWSELDAALLTHTHSDHWRDATLKKLLQHEVPLYCHQSHAQHLRYRSDRFAEMESTGLVKCYQSHQEDLLPGNVKFVPFAVSHDAGPTFGFRFEGPNSRKSRGWVLAYAADMGTWTHELVPLLADVDLLALEFNHDVKMQLSSPRPESLIERILSDQGHLSNTQAAELLSAILNVSEPGRLRTLVQLHLSQDCNRPVLARKAAQAVLSRRQTQVEVVTASQDQVTRVSR